MNTYTEQELTHLITRFEKGLLPKPEWTHEAHLAVAVWCLWENEEAEALRLAREHIRAHNTAVGTENSDTGGYHETITRFWITVTARFMAAQTFGSVTEACNALIAAPEGKSDYPLVFYSRERLFTVEARHAWVEPDLKEMK